MKEWLPNDKNFLLQKLMDYELLMAVSKYHNEKIFSKVGFQSNFITVHLQNFYIV